MSRLIAYGYLCAVRPYCASYQLSALVIPQQNLLDALLHHYSFFLIDYVSPEKTEQVDLKLEQESSSVSGVGCGLRT